MRLFHARRVNLKVLRHCLRMTVLKYPTDHMKKLIMQNSQISVQLLALKYYFRGVVQMKLYSRFFFLIIISILSIFMIINPQETVNAASSGFQLWLSVVVPALLPFFIVADLLLAMGMANFLGVLLEPVMRPLFRLPGCSSLVVVMGFTSGFPVGAILSRKLYDQKMLSADETERLVSFTNNSSPLFILGAVGVGMFASPVLGYLLAASHYLSNLLLGILWRFRAKAKPVSKNKSPRSFRQAYQALLEANQKNPHSPGKMLGDAIKNSLNNILAIAGFIIIFSVITRMFAVWGIIKYLAILFMKIFSFLNLPYTVVYGMGMGMFEITIGSSTIAMAPQGALIHKLLAVSAIMAFSGFSIIAQVMSIVTGIPVRMSFYLLSRFIQMCLSVSICWIAYKVFVVPIQSIHSLSIPLYKILYSFNAWHFSLNCLLLGLLVIVVMILSSILLTDQ